MTSLTVLYDETCPLCVRCRTWLEAQPAYVPLVFLPCGGAAARERYGELPWLGQELIVINDQGDVWVGSAAFLVCLWALDGYRELSYTLSGPVLSRFAERFFHVLSSQRRTVSTLFEHTRCTDGACALPHGGPYR